MKNRNHINIFIVGYFFVLFIFSSCVSQKNITYFQKGENDRDTIAITQAYIPKIQTGDLLSISVSSLSATASSFFNPYGGSLSEEASFTPNQTSNASGYLVDEKGFIELPLIGQVKVVDLSTSVAKDTIKERLKVFLKEPTVNIRFLNYKVSVMGEVARPAVYVIANEKITLPEALSMAGDLTIHAKRENILIIRDNNGTKEFGRVNLNNREVFNSPYYYLRSNDIIYVEQGKAKAAQADQAYRILPIVISTLSLFALILRYSR